MWELGEYKILQTSKKIKNKTHNVESLCHSRVPKSSENIISKKYQTQCVYFNIISLPFAYRSRDSYLKWTPHICYRNIIKEYWIFLFQLCTSDEYNTTDTIAWCNLHATFGPSYFSEYSYFHDSLNPSVFSCRTYNNDIIIIHTMRYYKRPSNYGATFSTRIMAIHANRVKYQFYFSRKKYLFLKIH